MSLQLIPATSLADLAFARALARRNMLPYYGEFGLLWVDDAFDECWQWRDNRLIEDDTGLLGFISLSVDQRALFIRELQMVESARGRGVGGLVLEWVHALAVQRGLPLVRLTVFKSNPAQRLYRRHGFEQVGEDECFLRMERQVVAKAGARRP
jgi:ribosomal protein S18 acetylase RimI-like enzyme